MILGTALKGVANISSIRQFVRYMQHSPNAQVLDGIKRKKFSELTPQEIEAEVNENLVLLRKSFEDDERENYVVPIFKKAILHADRPAIRDTHGEYSYIQIYVSAKRLAIQLSNICGSAAMRNIGYLCANSVLTTLTQWACWISGQVAMPMDMCNSPEMLKTLLRESKASTLIVSPEYERLGWEVSSALDISLLIIDHTFMVSSKTTLLSVPRIMLSSFGKVMVEGTCSNNFYTNANAMLLYKLGMTGEKPKGVMLTHRNLDAQMKSLMKAWKYDPSDCLMHALPLQHSHGFINASMCPLNVGGRILMHDQLKGSDLWSTLLGINTPVKDRVNIFVGVPAIYNSLIAEYQKSLAKNSKMASYVSNYCKENIRLMVSGGTPLPPTLYRRWRDITGHGILECYGATEIGLALSNLYGDADKQEEVVCKKEAGLVGLPLPDVRVRLVDSNEKVLIDCIGEIDDNKWSVRFLDTKPKTSDLTEDVMQGKFPRIYSFISSFSSTVKKTLETLKILKLKKTLESLKTSELKKTLESLKTSELKKTLETIIPWMKSKSKPQFENNMSESVDSTVDRIVYESEGVFVAELNAMKAKRARDEGSKELESLFGELQVSGPTVFTQYYGNPDATTDVFDEDFYRTGDMAIFQDGVFKILGRRNIDFIEVGGKKISNCDVESLILANPGLRDVKVIMEPEDVGKIAKKGQTKLFSYLGVVCVLQKNIKLDEDELMKVCSKSLPNFLIPTSLEIVDELPTSDKSKINRNSLRNILKDNKDEPDKSTQ